MMKWQRILITGASSGLGWALAMELARPGVTFFLSGRNQQRLDQLALQIQEKGASAHTVVADLSSRDGEQQLIGLIEREVPDLLIQNAGIGTYGTFVDVDLVRSDEIMHVNVMALMATTRAWSRALISRVLPGKVIFISSSAAFLPCPGMTVYAASKAWVNSFAEGLRYELRDQGISVLTVCPGHFVTNFQRRAAGRVLSEPASPEAFEVARDIVRVMEKEGVYVPMPWRWLLMLRWLVPQGFLMKYMERRVLANLE